MKDTEALAFYLCDTSIIQCSGHYRGKSAKSVLLFPFHIRFHLVIDHRLVSKYF